MKKLDLTKLKDSSKFITTRESLKDVTPLYLPEEVLSGKKKICVHHVK